MGSNDNLSLILSIVIACLVIFPLSLVIGTLVSGFINLPYQNILPIHILSIIAFVLCLAALGLYIPSFITYLVGSSANKPNAVAAGFGVGLPSWILSFFIIFLMEQITSISNSYINQSLLLLLYFIYIGFPFTIAPYAMPMPTKWLVIISRLNIIVAITCIVLGSIVLYRRKYL